MFPLMVDEFSLRGHVRSSDIREELRAEPLQLEAPEQASCARPEDVFLKGCLWYGEPGGG